MISLILLSALFKSRVTLLFLIFLTESDYEITSQDGSDFIGIAPTESLNLLN